MNGDNEDRPGTQFDELDESSPPIDYESNGDNGDDDDEDDDEGEDADVDVDADADLDIEEEEELEVIDEVEPVRFEAETLDAEESEEDAGEIGAPAAVGDGVGRAAAVLKYIVERIVDEPEKISIGAAEDDRGPVLLLRVAEDDRGKVIGRQGRIVQAIRTVVKAATVGTGEKVSVEIID